MHPLSIQDSRCSKEQTARRKRAFSTATIVALTISYLGRLLRRRRTGSWSLVCQEQKVLSTLKLVYVFNFYVLVLVAHFLLSCCQLSCAHVDELQDLERPGNDSCDAAFELSSIPSTIGGDSTGSFTDFDVSTCSVTPDDRGIWYKFTAKEDKILELQVTSATFNNRLVVFTGPCSLPSCFAENDGSGFGSFLSWQGVANTEYSVLVTGVSGFNDAGTFTLGVSVRVFGAQSDAKVPAFCSSILSVYFLNIYH